MTPREREILCMLCLSNKEISKRLHIAEGTVENHVSNLFNSFPLAENRSQMLFTALIQGVVKPEEIVIG